MKNVMYVFIIFLLFIACNKRLLVDKRSVVNSVNGYLTFFKGQVVFYPWKDTNDVDFLNNSHKNGFRVRRKDIDWLDSIATRYPIFISKEIPIMQLPDTISIIPVKVQYFLGDNWTKKSATNTLFYYQNNTSHTVTYKLSDYRQILLISVIRDSDVELINEYNRRKY